MAKQSDSPFTRDDYRKLREALRCCHDLPAEFDRAEACGVDCSALRGVTDQIRGQLDAIERNYFVPPPK